MQMMRKLYTQMVLEKNQIKGENLVQIGGMKKKNKEKNWQWQSSRQRSALSDQKSLVGNGEAFLRGARPTREKPLTRGFWGGYPVNKRILQTLGRAPASKGRFAALNLQRFCL